MTKILIQENHFFNQTSWEKEFSDNFPSYLKNLNIKYVKSNIDFNKFLPDSEICFGFKRYK